MILDISGSMGQNVQTILRRYLVCALEMLGIGEITLITFESTSRIYKLQTSALRNSDITCAGSTRILPALQLLESVIRNAPTTECIRILTISDGAIDDQLAAVQFATALSKTISDRQISSTTIRYFTSQSQPDTRALSSVMQLDTLGKGCNITDIDGRHEPAGIINAIYRALEAQFYSGTLTSSVSNLRRSPWAPATDRITLKPGLNIFWIDTETADSQLSISSGDKLLADTDAHSLKPTLSPLTIDNYTEILGPKISEYTDRLKISKVVAADKDDIMNILGYFQALETQLQLSGDQPGRGLKDRFRALTRKRRGVYLKLSELANDDRVSKMNASQQADYLRTAQHSSNSVNLAKIAARQGMDFDVRAQAEVRALASHISELSDIDSDGHSVSFYSQCTTMDGIRTLAELAATPDFDSVSALDILLLLNLVGVPCVGAIGEFPDPKTYFVSEVYESSRVSMSDLLTVSSMAHGRESEELQDPYSRRRIWNVVPVYDDDRIQRFLMKYAPTLLEYTASLGMRRMTLEVPHTYKCTIVGGLWCILRTIQDSPTEAYARLAMDMVTTYRTAVGKYFAHILALVGDSVISTSQSFYIGNNGITNMIGPLIDLLSSGQKRNIPAILRALYCYEFHQIIRKFHRTDSDGQQKRKALLDKVLGVDYGLYGTPLPAMYSGADLEPHHDQYYIGTGEYQDIVSKGAWIDRITLLPSLLEACLSGDPDRVTEVCRTAKAPETYLGLSDLATFKLFCIAQAFIYETRESRVHDGDGDGHVGAHMKFTDPGHYEIMRREVSAYIRAQYDADYQVRLKEQNVKASKLLTDKLVATLIDSDSPSQFATLLRDGLTCGNIHVGFAHSFTPGASDLAKALLSPELTVPCRAEKLHIFLLGCTYDDEPALVWNAGNVYKMDYKRLLLAIGTLGLEQRLEATLRTYKDRAVHLYRSEINRHKHSNANPSYWAYGYKNLGAYFEAITKELQLEYCKTHTHCCGIWDGVVVRLA